MRSTLCCYPDTGNLNLQSVTLQPGFRKSKIPTLFVLLGFSRSFCATGVALGLQAFSLQYSTANGADAPHPLINPLEPPTTAYHRSYIMRNRAHLRLFRS